jgi:predicted phage terminase large subunit-like protein
MYGAKYSYATRSGKTPDVAIIEDKGSGISLRQHLARQGFATWKYNPGRASKLERLHVVSHWFHQKRVWVPESKKNPGNFATWAADFIGQVCSYSGPGTTYHDDFIDTATQALRCIADRGMLRVEQPEEASIRAANVVRLSQARNPYDC